MELDSQISIQTPTGKHSQVIDILAEDIRERITRQRELGPRAAGVILDVLDNGIRIGWAIIDVRKEFKGLQDAFDAFIESSLPIGRTQAYKYMQASRGFQRDEENLGRSAEIRAIIGLTPLLFDVHCTVSLKQQLIETNANSFSELMRANGIAKPKQLGSGMMRIEAKPAFLRFGKTLSMGWVRYNRIIKDSPISEWADEERRAVRQDLKPYVELYESLT